MSTKKIILSIALLGSVLSPASLSADMCESFKNEYDGFKKLEYPTKALYLGKGAALAFLISSIYTLMYNDPKPDAKQRHEWKKAIDLSLISKDPGKYIENWKYIYLDWWVGQYFKDKHMVWKPKTGIIKQSRKCMPFGVLGWTFSHLILIDKTKNMMSGITAAASAFFGLRALGFMSGKEEKKPDKPVIIALTKETIDALGASLNQEDQE